MSYLVDTEAQVGWNEGYAVSEIVREKRNQVPNWNRIWVPRKILSSQEENSEKEQSETPEIPEESKSVDSEIRLAFAFQSKGWAGTLMDRLNTFSYKDLYKKRIAKVKAKTADIRNRVEAVRKYKKSE